MHCMVDLLEKIEKLEKEMEKTDENGLRKRAIKESEFAVCLQTIQSEY